VRICTSGTLDADDSGADVDLDVVWDDQLLLREDVLHLEQLYEVCDERLSWAQFGKSGLETKSQNQNRCELGAETSDLIGRCPTRK